MIDALRMDLVDCGSPESLIDVILRHHPEWRPPVPIVPLAISLGITELKDLAVEGFEGALLTDELKDRGIILVKAGTKPRRRRFTIGHELGHFLIPTHHGNRQCTTADLREVTRQGAMERRQEAEANRFSAGILMPKAWFEEDIGKLGSPDVMHLSDLSSRYETSIEAVANRYVELTEQPCAFVFSYRGTIRYLRRSPLFPRLIAEAKQKLPTRSASARLSVGQGRAIPQWREVDPAVWLTSSWGAPLPSLLEQPLQQDNGFVVTLLLLGSSDDDTDDQDENDLLDSWTPRFHR